MLTFFCVAYSTFQLFSDDNVCPFFSDFRLFFFVVLFKSFVLSLMIVE